MSKMWENLTAVRTNIFKQLAEEKLNYKKALHNAKEYDELKEIMLRIQNLQSRIKLINNRIEDL